MSRSKGPTSGPSSLSRDLQLKNGSNHVLITFSLENLQLKDYLPNDAMVISCVIEGFVVHNVLVDIGNAVDIIFAKALR
jgi:hypothetical protein